MSDEEARGERSTGRIPRRFTLALAGIGALLVVTVPFWAPLFMRRMDFFRVRRLEIVGTRYIATADIIARANVDTTRSVWDATAPIVDRVRTHAGVERVEIHRKLPGTLVITVTEYQPIALVSGPQGFRVFDERGVALPIDPSRVDVDAPVLAAPDPELLHLLAGMKRSLAPLYSRVSELKRVGTHELLFQLDDAPVWTLTTVSLEDLHQIDAVEENLRQRAAHVLELDLRYKDQIIARLQ